MTKIVRVSKEHDLGRCDRGVGRAAARAGAAARGPAGARERPGGSGVREGAVAVREGPRAGGPTGSRDEGTAVPVRCRIGAGTRPAASRCRGTRRTLRTRGRCSVVSLSHGRGVSVSRRARLLGNHALQILSDGPAFGGGAGRVVRDHAGGFPVAGQHDFRGGRAARRQFGRQPDPATVRRHARLDAGGAGGGGEAALNLPRRQPDHPIRGGGVGTAARMVRIARAAPFFR